MATKKPRVAAARPPKRFSYHALNAQQLQIALALLDITPEQVEQALDEAAQIALDNAAADALSTFGLTTATPSAPAKPAAPREVPAPRTAKRASTKARKSRAAARRGTATHTGSNGSAESRQLQGRYIAAIRRVPRPRRKEFKALVAGPGGRAAAIEAIDRAYPK